MSNRGTKAAAETRWRKAQYAAGRLQGEAGQPAAFADAHYMRGFRRGYRLFQMHDPKHAHAKLLGTLVEYINDEQRQADQHLHRVERLNKIKQAVQRKTPKKWRDVAEVKLVIDRYYITRPTYNKKPKYGDPVLMKWTERGWETTIGKDITYCNQLQVAT